MTPIEKLIKECNPYILETPDDEYERGNNAGVRSCLTVATSSLPTEAEHTKQIGTGFAEWLNNETIDSDKGVEYRYHIDSGEDWGIPELWDEYILTLQNKKG